MADIKIQDLLSATTVADTDLFIVEDNADTKKITKANLANAFGISGLFDLVGLGGVVESGSNSNGTFIKFADGTMIAWSEATVTTTSTTALENGGFRTGSNGFSLPATFHATPRVVASSRNSTRDVGLYAESTNVSTLNIIFKTISSDSTSRVHIAHWIAIGRWKA